MAASITARCRGVLEHGQPEGDRVGAGRQGAFVHEALAGEVQLRPQGIAQVEAQQGEALASWVGWSPRLIRRLGTQ